MHLTRVKCPLFTIHFNNYKFTYLDLSEDFSTVQYKKNPAGNPPRQFPPYNGWGSEEDSLCSCMGLLPKPPKRDFIKFMEKDRRGLDSNVLRFLARMDTTKPIDQERRFIISYFLSDDTISVFEPPVRNSGNYMNIWIINTLIFIKIRYMLVVVNGNDLILTRFYTPES